MKKLALLFTLALFCMSLFAQTPVVKKQFKGDRIENQKLIKGTDWMSPQSVYREDIQEEWYSYTSAVDYYLGGTLLYYTNAIFPDSQVVRINSDGELFRVRWHSMGAAFDGRDEIFGFYGNGQLEDRQPYKLDSIAFRYLYEKYNDAALKDELVIQFYNSSKLDRYTWTSTQEPWVTVKFDQNTLSGVDYDKEIRYELDYDDTANWSGGQYKWLEFAVDMDVPKAPHPAIAVTFTFQPAYSHQMDDTLYGPDPYSPYKKLNNFWHQMFYDPDGSPIANYNNGMLMNYEVRYGLLTGNLAVLNYSYLPGSAFGVSYYPYMLFKITYDADWVDAINEDNVNFKVGEVYPNPSAGKSKVTVKLENTAKVSVDLVNPLGQTVRAIESASLRAGEHHINLNTNDFDAGIYFVKVNVGDYSSTQRIMIR
ncbi:MAG: T9SS type A sorting domain-containing protein [Bacteroidetes bacterium]|nr:T9SS type A sorting domain-containing protein [Bacteroidota bacterium]